MKSRDIAFVSIGAVIITVSAILTIPFAVPFTFQSFGVFFVLLVFGGKRGTFSVSVYLSLGLVGIPVFSGFGAGFGVVFGPTGGYLVGFLIIGLVYWFFEKYLKKDFQKILMMFLCMAIYYAVGTLFFVIWGGSEQTFLAALPVAVFPFLLPDIAKMALAFFIYKRIGVLI